MSLASKECIRVIFFLVIGIVSIAYSMNWYGNNIIRPFLVEHKEIDEKKTLGFLILGFLGLMFFTTAFTLPTAKDTYFYNITAEVIAYNDSSTFFKTDNSDIYEANGYYNNGTYLLQMNRNNTWKTEDDYIEIVYLAVDDCYTDTGVG